MRIISERTLRQFTETNASSRSSINEWIRIVRAADWSNFADIKRTFNSADICRQCVVFNVGGNKFRVIAKIAFRIKVVFIRKILTDRDYDQNAWRPDCES